MMKNLVLFIVSILILGEAASSQKYAVNSQACPATENKQALKVYNKIEKAKDGTAKRELLQQAVEIEPDFHEALFDLSIRYFRSNNYKKATEYLDHVIALCPDYSGYLYYMKGWIGYYSEDYTSAAQGFEKFLSFDNIGDKEYLEVKAVIEEVNAKAELYAHPVPFDPQPVPGVCSARDEYLGNLSPDNRNFYYIRKIEVETNGMNNVAGRPSEPREIFMVSKHSGGLYDSGTYMDAPFNTKHNNGAATITADNKEMYFVICDEGTVESCDIWQSKMTEGRWSELKKLGPEVNSPYWDSQPTVSYDGQTLIFTSNRPGGKGQADLYYCTRKPDGSWSPAINMGDSINTPESDISPFLHSDSQTLYFSSRGHKGLGDYDIFYTRKMDNGEWVKPKNLGYPINNKESDVSFFVSLDGKTGYYASTKLAGPGGYDIFSFQMPELARPEEVYFIEGSVAIDPGVKKTVTEIEIKNLDTKDVTKINVDSTDGTYVAVVTAKNDYLLSIKQEGIAFESTLISSETANIGKPETKELEAKEIKKGEAYRLNDVNFATNSFQLSLQAQNILEGFAEFLAVNKSLKVAIHGHTDNVGNAGDNLLLSENRAKSVYEFLVSKGIDTSRLSFKGFGSSKPLKSNNTEMGKAENRRTEFVIQ